MYMHESAVPGTDWLLPGWPVDARVRAFVTTRNGGVSRAPYASLNLGTGVRDDARDVAENRRRVLGHLPAQPCWLRQVHGADVVTLSSAPDVAPIADAAVTRTAGLPLAVLVADCMPVLLAERAGEAIGIAHAGWRGLAAGVVEATIGAMACAPERVVAWLGPAIGPDAFEVGADVRDAFVAVDSAAAASFHPLREGKWLADLPALAHARLRAAGVTGVHGGRWCTVRDGQRFYSYRRDGETGRMAAFLWLDGAGSS